MVFKETYSKMDFCCVGHLFKRARGHHSRGSAGQPDVARRSDAVDGPAGRAPRVGRGQRPGKLFTLFGKGLFPDRLHVRVASGIVDALPPTAVAARVVVADPRGQFAICELPGSLEPGLFSLWTATARLTGPLKPVHLNLPRPQWLSQPAAWPGQEVRVGGQLRRPAVRRPQRNALSHRPPTLPARRLPVAQDRLLRRGLRSDSRRRICAAAGSLAWVGINGPQSAADFHLRGAHVILSSAFPPLVSHHRPIPCRRKRSMLRTTAKLMCCAAIGLLVLGMAPARQAAAVDEPGFRSLFDGKTLDGWDGDPQLWRVEDGAITGETTTEKPAKHNTFLIWRGGKPADFELKAEFRMVDVGSGFGNSGIQIRSWESPTEKWRVMGYQPDMDLGNSYTGFIYGEGFRGILAQRGTKTTIHAGNKKTIEKFADARELAKVIKKGADWNEYDIIAQGNHFSQKVNGTPMCELTDNDTVARKDGIIALQLHAGKPMKVQFRNIRIRETKNCSAAAVEPAKKIVFIAGKPSHGYAQHEHYAGCQLLARLLQENVPGVETVVVKGWPADAKVLDGAAAIVIYADGGGGHPAMQHMDELDKLMHKGVGLACIHYAVEIPKGKEGDLLKSWIGGYYETFWSVNPHYTADFKALPSHPVANGVKPFSISDEWYFHMRFVDEMKGVTPILTAIPPDEVHRKGNDAHGANPVVFARKGQPEQLAWVYERPGGGRGFGFTGGHFHWNWGCRSFRTTVLNGIVWTAGMEVPAAGVPSNPLGLEDLEANLDTKNAPQNAKAQAVKLLEEIQKKNEQ
jgi:type 1 glutamine amidotransferase